MYGDPPHYFVIDFYILLNPIFIKISKIIHLIKTKDNFNDLYFFI